MSELERQELARRAAAELGPLTDEQCAQVAHLLRLVVTQNRARKAPRKP